MPLWAYQLPPLLLALIMISVIEAISLTGLLLTRRFLLPRFRLHEGVNEAISGTVQAIGVFYGITVGLIAAGVWNTNSNAADLVSREATSIAGLHRDLSGYPSPQREELREKLREYTVFIINEAWPAQTRGELTNHGAGILDEFQAKLYHMDPTTTGQSVLHGETLAQYNKLLEFRRLRNIAVSSGLSTVMWAVIWVGAGISISVAYLYRIEDPKIHATLVFLMAGFLSMVLFMIVINDKPFFGSVSISSDPYKLVLERVLEVSR